MVGPAIGPFRAAAARDPATNFDPGGPASSTALGLRMIRPLVDSSARQPSQARSLRSARFGLCDKLVRPSSTYQISQLETRHALAHYSPFKPERGAKASL